MNRSLLILVLLVYSANGWSQIAQTDTLFTQLAQKDSLLFDAAFNSCKVAVLEDLFTKDFEFYHDKGGLTENREAFLKPMRENCANRDFAKPQNSYRHLVPNSLKVYPLYKDGKLYGAIQHGEHTFTYLDQDNTYQRGDIAKFTHIWLLMDKKWKLRRELSYDHKPQN